MAIVAATQQTPPALAQQGSANGLFSITPARREIEARPPRPLAPTDVFNGTQETFDVRVFPVLLTQNLTGAFDFTDDPVQLRKAQLTVSSTPDTFVLAPGQTRQVKVRWENIERGRFEAYVGLVFQGTPRKRGGAVGNVLRLLSINLLGLPNRPAPQGRFAGLQVQAIDKKLHFLIDVKNTGKVLGRPTQTRLLVRDAAGGLVLRKRWSGDVILPGVKRRFDVKANKVLEAGEYSATAEMRFGRGGLQRVTQKFTLVGPNELPTAQLAVATPVGSGEIGGQAHIRALVENKGSAPAGTRATVTLSFLAPALRQVALKRVVVPPLLPRSSRSLELDLGPSLRKGTYRVNIRYRDAAGAVRDVSADFSPTRPRSAADRFGDILKIALPVLGLLGLLLLIAYLVRRQRRLRERLEELERAGSGREAGAPPAPAADRPPASAVPVNVNTAGVDELSSLPGVGPRAAQRIVDHREEFGPFASIEGLRAVEGFDEERVRGLGEQAEV